MPTKEDLAYLQKLPLDLKVMMTKARIREWVSRFGTDGVYVSFSGGKDSTVLLHLVREEYPNIEAVFVNTGLEYPEIQKFVKSFENVTILRPKMSFVEVIRKYGYPIVSKSVAHNVSIARNSPNGKIVQNVFNPTKKGKFAMHKWLPLAGVDFKISENCCAVMKKSPVKSISKKPILATMTDESAMREAIWLENGCNAFELKRPHSAPMSFWTEQDVLHYISQNNIPIASVYGEVIPDTVNDGQMAIDDSLVNLKCTGCQRTGCIFCGFGAHLDEKESRFERLKRTHPKQYEFLPRRRRVQRRGDLAAERKGLRNEARF